MSSRGCPSLVTTGGSKRTFRVAPKGPKWPVSPPPKKKWSVGVNFFTALDVFFTDTRVTVLRDAQFGESEFNFHYLVCLKTKKCQSLKEQLESSNRKTSTANPQPPTAQNANRANRQPRKPPTAQTANRANCQPPTLPEGSC